MDRFPNSPPPSYESVVGQPLEPLHVPPRYLGPSEGRSSIRYAQLPALYDTTKIYLVDNKSADIASLNYQNNHSSYLTTVVQNSDYSPMEAGTQNINLDDRSRWGGEFKTILYMNMPNITEFMFSNSFRVKVMTKFVPNASNAADPQPPSCIKPLKGTATYEWVTLSIPEGNYSDITVIDLMNNAIIEHYLNGPRQNKVEEYQIGVKIDTRNMRLGYDPQTKLIMPGKYTYKAFHPDIILAPGCAIDFTYSRLNNLLGIRKRYPYQTGFIIDYEDLVDGEIPALLDVAKYEKEKETTDSLSKIKCVPLECDSKGRPYFVNMDKDSPTGYKTHYRSWYLAYNYGHPEKGIKASTLLVNPDVTCGMEQIYWSLPDMAIEPVTFKASNTPTNYPVVGTELLPVKASTFYNTAAVYAQMVQDVTNNTFIFNRFPENQILLRPPESTITSICENVPAQTDHGTLPLKNSIPGVQRVTLTDARRRVCPYVYKSLGVVCPKVLSSRTF